MSLIVYEPICSRMEHSQFNASFLECLHFAFPDQPIVFVGEEQHLSYVQALLPRSMGESVEFKALNIPQRHLKPQKRFIRDTKNAFEILDICRSAKSQALILTSCRETVLFSLAFALFIMRHNLKRYSIVHMEMRKIVTRSRNPIFRALDFASSLSIAAKLGIEYWVLEESIRTEVLKYLPKTKNYLQVLPHPVVQRKTNSNAGDSLPIKLGFLGLATKRKGFDVFKKIAKKAHDYSCYSCYVVGRYDETDTSIPKEYFAQGPFSEHLPHAKYNQLTSEINYICVFLDQERYSLSASGTLLDALSFGKPIIALNIPIIKQLFNEYGDIGFLCNDELEINQVLEQLSKGLDPDRYTTQTNNIKKIVLDRSPSVLAKVVRSNINIAPDTSRD